MLAASTFVTVAFQKQPKGNVALKKSSPRYRLTADIDLNNDGLDCGAVTTESDAPGSTEATVVVKGVLRAFVFAEFLPQHDDGAVMDDCERRRGTRDIWGQ